MGNIPSQRVALKAPATPPRGWFSEKERVGNSAVFLTRALIGSSFAIFAILCAKIFRLSYGRGFAQKGAKITKT
jgi:hypothetical protein